KASPKDRDRTFAHGTSSRSLRRIYLHRPPMAELKYRFNPDTLNFERIQLSACQKVKRLTLLLAPGLMVGLLGILLVYQFVDSPKEAAMRRENQQLLVQY